jgi:hypothetical protein
MFRINGHFLWRVVANTVVPLSYQRSQLEPIGLQWAGFGSDDGLLYVLDRGGKVNRLLRDFDSTDWYWMPVGDVETANKCDFERRFWPIAVSRNELQFFPLESRQPDVCLVSVASHFLPVCLSLSLSHILSFVLF